MGLLRRRQTRQTGDKATEMTSVDTASLRIPDNLKQCPNRNPEMFMHSDTSNENLFHLDCLPCVLAQNDKFRRLKKKTFVIYFGKQCCFFPLLFEQQTCLERCGCIWELTSSLAQGANADPELAGQMSAHAPAFCCWLHVEMSNTMMGYEAAGELPAW